MLVMGDYWYWLAMAAPAIGLLAWKRGEPRRAVWWAGASLAWMGVFLLTEDRRMFFPYAMQLAAVAGALSPVAAIPMALWFLTIRIAQDASLSVLAVEAGVVCVALGVAAWLRRRLGIWQSVLGCALLALVGLLVN